ncbi:MAG: hypothetical protein WCH85_06440 [Methanomicrobiales archaeon]
MNSIPAVNRITETNQEQQVNNILRERQDTTGTGLSGNTEIECVRGEGAGRTPEEVATSRSVSGIAAMTGEWGT